MDSPRLAFAILFCGVVASATGPIPQARAQGVPPASDALVDESLPTLIGPLSAGRMIGLPVRTYGDAPAVANVDDLLMKADGTVDKLVLDDGTFLRMGLDGKRVALPYASAALVPGSDGAPSYLRINIAKAYGQVIKEFRYELISPSDFALKAVLGAPVAAADAPSAGRLDTLWIGQGGHIDHAEISLDPDSSLASWTIALPFSDLSFRRPASRTETRVVTFRTLNQLKALPPINTPALPMGRAMGRTMGQPGFTPAPANQVPAVPSTYAPSSQTPMGWTTGESGAAPVGPQGAPAALVPPPTSIDVPPMR
ncbi:hypothetical protein [Rhodospirillum rubrum]|uniref:Uncharacterized protein n=1 Tax=Rhodospirillum rubrum (strain ATCC 11170 / ATH 1.1.1 / DSM 467 / LMG 4362 / NCIMB 8255 / S1) TaxID=269796 RepID=Q2RT36_RHORT|nr:hypothetical protein [Rhodospirillum rubrum]ABC22709.1 hypothetical protein Rru_A1909 [Rhodospirillum rubrum ATCC 11170]AEO48428.1 hypothetical protein F11_09810 [Rhodospirillum rubrum F11]MBK5954307.1 hypothetical protein [Rhodospirillum rubrum]QXG78701.1 hypothetical protein KUL73_09875 [Rhodospirillum rubrum]HAP98633.1 hypothetical protein [Rhodospirillum rubrum]